MPPCNASDDYMFVRSIWLQIGLLENWTALVVLYGFHSLKRTLHSIPVCASTDTLEPFIQESNYTGRILFCDVDSVPVLWRRSVSIVVYMGEHLIVFLETNGASYEQKWPLPPFPSCPLSSRDCCSPCRQEGSTLEGKALWMDMTSPGKQETMSIKNLLPYHQIMKIVIIILSLLT